MKKCNFIDWIALILVIIGAINWGLVGLFHWNLVNAIFSQSIITRIIYIVIGLAGLWAIYMMTKCGKSCNSGS
ncbi:MAG: DUF378 domain-containing protein [Gammaproteobacteria bacterium]|nr:DUF378 domain-containing protein [Gammaproteobacteria bacterium]